MNRINACSALAASVCLAAIMLLACPARSATPYEALAQAAQAMDAADAEQFAQVVDIDSLARQALEEFVAQSGQLAGKGAGGVAGMLLIQGLGASPNSLRDLLISEGRAFVLNSIASGAFAGRHVDNAPASGVLAPLFSGASMGRKAVVSVGDAQSQDDGYILPFVVHDYGNGYDYAVEGLFLEDNGILRLKGIRNMSELVRQIITESGF